MMGSAPSQPPQRRFTSTELDGVRNPLREEKTPSRDVQTPGEFVIPPNLFRSTSFTMEEASKAFETFARVMANHGTEKLVTKSTGLK